MALFSRRHYTATANALAAAQNYVPRYPNDPNALAGYRGAIHALADLFAADNPKFDREKFLRAAGAK